MSSILIDTNLFVLLVVGTYNITTINKHKRTKSFTEDDYYYLVKLLQQYKELWVMSHSIGEISNLLMQTNEKLSLELMKVYSALILDAKESHIPKNILFNEKIILRLGVTDAGFIIKSKRVDTVITTDLDLYLAVSQYKDVNVYNWNHLRQSYYFS